MSALPLSVGIPSILTIGSTVLFLSLERIRPGRPLPPVEGWYTRTILMNLAQVLITLATASLWFRLLGRSPLFHLSNGVGPLVQGLTAWFVGTFIFYWWHRLRHANGWWRLFHQIHHSPSRIEILTSFYKHPIEILADSALSALVLYPLLGCSVAGGFWYNLFAATGEYFYHANVKTPRWLRFLMQTPELHSAHHELDVHTYNFGDIPLWDRMFGTYRDMTDFATHCGFPKGAEGKLASMLAFREVYAG